MVVNLRVTPQTVSFQTTTKLREAIMQGHFAPGERLVESSLCETMGVSRTTIREALRRLESERLIHNIPNRGPSVATMSDQEAAEIYHVRRLLEGEAAALFSQRVTDEQIAQLDEALRQFEAAANSEHPIERLKSTARFYDVILGGCANHIIREVLESLIARVNLLRAKSMASPGRAKFSLMEMRRIRDAIKNRDPIAARAAAEEHVTAAERAARHLDEPGQAKRMSAAGQVSPQ